jgi:hypothetical protein
MISADDGFESAAANVSNPEAPAARRAQAGFTGSFQSLQETSVRG